MKIFELLFGPMIDRRIAASQNQMITRHFDEVENMYRQMRGWRHDFHNHIQTMKAHLLLGQTQELEQYLNQLDADLTQVDTVIKTGNIMIDAILNSKLSLIRAQGITANFKASVPKKLSVVEVDLCVIIGNLLDNAMEACLRQDEGEQRFIRLYIGILRQQLYISVSNSTGRAIRKHEGGYLSEKDPSHGLGLIRIDRIVDKYKGYVDRQNEEGVFVSEILLPL